MNVETPTKFATQAIPETETTQPLTKPIGTGSIYAITPVSEDIARSMAESSQKASVEAFELTPKLIRDVIHSTMFDDGAGDDEDAF